MQLLLKYFCENYGNLASLAGLFVSFVILARTKRLQEAYILKGRVPQLVADLEQHASNLSLYIRTRSKSGPDLTTALTGASAVLKSLKKYDKSGVTDALKAVAAVDRRNLDHDCVSDAYYAIQIVIQQLKVDIINQDWRKS